jgi:hypothetical protein
MNVFYRIRVWIKTHFARWFAREYCQDCGCEQPVVWFADNTLYANVMGLTDTGYCMEGVTCPGCFSKRAEAKGIFLRWEPK